MPYGELWREFGAASARRRAALDGRGYAIYCVVMLAAAVRVTYFRHESDVVTLDELRQHAGTMALALAGAGAALALPEQRYLILRPYLLILLRLLTSISPVLTRSALAMIHWAPKDPALRSLTTAFAVLLEDHVLLQTLLALALPLNLPLSAVMQAMCIWIISQRNFEACRAGVAAAPLGESLGEHRVGYCTAASLFMQIMLGIAMPLWHIACGDSAAAVEWWQRRVGRPGRSWRYAAYAWIDSKPCKHARIVQRATLAFVAVWVWTAAALWAAGM